MSIELPCRIKDYKEKKLMSLISYKEISKKVRGELKVAENSAEYKNVAEKVEKKAKKKLKN